jgi:MFS transporter, ACS family, hexuronate transporter
VQARTAAMAGMALFLPLSLAGYLMPSGATAAALALISVACFAHMAWGTNSLTLHTDLFPRDRVATVMGITGAAGSIGGILAGQTVGLLVDRWGTYLPVFLVTACLHPLAAAILVFGLRSPGRAGAGRG